MESVCGMPAFLMLSAKSSRAANIILYNVLVGRPDEFVIS